MLEITAERGGKAEFTHRHVHVESQVALFAGADTTSIALTSILYYILQALRLHPGVAFHLPHVVPAGGTTIAGVYIPSGYRVGVNAGVVHYDKEIFGSDAANFNPDRWLKSERAVAMRRVMMPFCMGARTCIGMHTAICQIYKLIPHILRHFEILFVDPEKPLQTRNFWFMKLVDVKVYFSYRKLDT
ncbi:hypothetical protein ASPCAL07133 [Aspergillus calidoustus]|uniref:Cytochrome P450 n=1 Tax=Aspergillus calidoustus TaxID=454130 RepID=A0A0U4Z8G5_ASPCI|nr:hypothetical protein ASPCAL07133 [Aspergillus calidoustus]